MSKISSIIFLCDILCREDGREEKGGKRGNRGLVTKSVYERLPWMHDSKSRLRDPAKVDFERL